MFGWSGQRAVDELRLELERLAADAVETGVDVFVDIAVVVDALEEVTNELRVLRVRGADEEVRLGVDSTRQLAPGDRDAVDVLLR